MSPVAMQAQLSLDVESQPALIVLGRDDSNKPHASWFGADEIDAARAAAKAMGMMALAVDAPEVVSLAGRLPHGKIFGSGKAFVPFVKQALFEDLIIHVPFAEQVRPLRVVRAEADGDSTAAPTPPAAPPSNEAGTLSVPQDWSKLGPGCLVLAVADDPAEGWFEAVILKAKGNTAFVCRWRDYPSEPHFERSLAGFALMHPSRVQSA